MSNLVLQPLSERGSGLRISDQATHAIRSIDSPTSSPTLQIQLLGDFSLTYGAAQVEGVNTPRLRSLLAYLVLHRRAPQLRQHLAFLFWPDTTEAQARTNLRQLWHQLRHILPDAEGFVHTDTTTLHWIPDRAYTLDVAAFEHALETADAAHHGDARCAALEKAALLYRGDLLPSCYDDWIIPERERLRQLYQQALKQLIQLLEQRKAYARAIHHTQHLLRDDPTDEVLACDLMRLFALNGDRAAALRVYHTCASVLQRELGIEPGQALRAAFDQLLHGTIPAGITLEREPTRDSIQPFISRKPEWEQLQVAWQRASMGHPGFVLITGEAGIGKSRLAEELLGWAARHGIGIARTRSYAAEGQLALAPVTDILRSDLLRPNLERLEAFWCTEVSRILPELLATQPLPPYEPITEYGQRQRFFEALARAVLIGQQPLLLLFDDLQWCDQETMEWLHFLLRFQHDAHLLIIGTARLEEVPAQHPLHTLLRHLQSTVHVTELPLQPLDAAETAQLAEQITGHELDLSMAMRLFNQTEGNPLFVVESMRAGFGPSKGMIAHTEKQFDPTREPGLQDPTLPPRVHAVIAGRLAQLSSDARELVELAAAIGRAFSLDLLLAASYADEAGVVRALVELWQKRIVREQSANRYDFTHDKLREIAYSETSAPQRRMLHRRIAQAMERITDDPIASSGQIASHYEHAGMAEHAIPYYQRAAVGAQRLYANEDAISLLVRGHLLLEGLPPGQKRDTQELQIQLALAPLYRMTQGWTSPEVEAVLSRAMVLCDTVGDNTQRIQILHGLQSLYVVQARLEKVQLVSEELQQLYHTTHNSEPPLVAEAMLSGSRLHLGRLVDANTAFAHIIATLDTSHLQHIMEKQGWNYAVHARSWHAHGLWLLGYPQAALHYGFEALRMANDLAQPFDQAVAITYLAMLQQLCADQSTAHAAAEQALLLTTEYKAPYYRSWSRILACYAQACNQPNPATITLLYEAITDFKASGARIRLPYYYGLLAQVCGRAGQVSQALVALEEGMSAARTHNERWWDAELHRLRGDMLLQSGVDPREAEQAYYRALDIARAQQARALELRATNSMAQHWLLHQRRDDARDLLQQCINWFSAGFDTPDLCTAKSLLAQL